MRKSIIIRISIVTVLLIGCICGGIYIYNYYQDSYEEDEQIKNAKNLIIENNDPEPTIKPVEETTVIAIPTEVPTNNTEKVVKIPTEERVILYDDTEEESDYDGEEPEETKPTGGTTKKNYTVICDENPDYVGWITVPGTRIDYPVVLNSEDPEKYLHTNFYGNYSYAGTPFCYFHTDIERPSDNIMIYGHNMKSGTMFHDLHKYKEESFYKEHKTFDFNSIYEDNTYEIMAVLLTDANAGNYEKYTILNFSEDTYNEFIKYLKKNALYNTEALDRAVFGDKLVSLTTCAYHTDNGRIVVIGRKI